MATRQTPLTCSGHTRPVVDLAFSKVTPDGFFLISACKDGKPMMRDGVTGDWIGTFEGHKGAVWSTRLNSDATKAITGSADFTAKLWDATNGKELLTIPQKHIVRVVDFSPDDQHVLTATLEKVIRKYDPAKPDQELVTFSGHEKPIKVATFYKGNDTILSAGDDKTVRLWDVRSGKETKKVEVDGEVTSAELSADATILTVTYGHTVAFWDSTSLEPIKSTKLDCPVHSATLHPSRERFVAGGLDFYLHVFDYNTDKEIDVYKGHHGPVHCVRYSPDGMLYASGSEDGTVRLWQDIPGVEYGLWRASKPDSPAPSGQ